MADRLVEDYLTRLDAAATALPPARRAELVEEITTHIAEARASGEVADEAALRTLLDRLGAPEDIVAAAHQEYPASRPVLPAPPRLRQENAAVLLMTAGSLIPFLGWLVGVVLLWSSTRWRAWEKVVATLIVPGGPFTALYFLALMPTQTCTGLAGGEQVCQGFSIEPGWLGVVLVVVAFVAPFVIGAVLLHRAGQRAQSLATLPQTASA